MTLTPEERRLLSQIAGLLAIPTTPDEVARAETEGERDALARIQRAVEIPATAEAVAEAEERVGKEWRRRWSLLSTRIPLRIAVAVLIAAAAGFALGLVYKRHEGHFMGSSGWTGIGQWSARGYRFDEINVPPETRVLYDVAFSLSQTQLGTAFALSEEFDAGVHLCAFGPDGRPLWSAKRDWPDWKETLGHDGVAFRAMKRLYTASKDGDLVESLCVVVSRPHQSYLCVVDAVTGERRRHVFFDGELVPNREVDTVQALPASEEGRRTLLIGGSIGRETDKKAVLLVLGSDGEDPQQLVFPVIAQGRVSDVHVGGVRANWQIWPVLVTVSTSEGVHFSLPFESGRLPLSKATASTTDNFLRNLRQLHGDDVAAMLEPFGGETRMLKGFARSIEERPGPDVTGWRK